MQVKNSTKTNLSALGVDFPAGKTTPVTEDMAARLRKDRYFMAAEGRGELSLSEKAARKTSTKAAAAESPDPKAEAEG